MSNIIHSMGEQFALRRDLRLEAKTGSLPYYAEELDWKGQLQARDLLTRTYLDKGVVNPGDVDTIFRNEQEYKSIKLEKDPYRGHAVYFGVRSTEKPGELLATGRLIRCDESGLNSLQIHSSELDEEWHRSLF